MANELSLTGKVIKVYPTQQVSEKYKKRLLVIEDNSNEKYPEIGMFEFGQDKVTLLDELRNGDNVTVAFNVRGRAYQKPGEDTKYFCSLQGWRLTINQTSKAAPAGYTAAEAPDLDGDDAPF
jgi:hypothetical protein